MMVIGLIEDQFDRRSGSPICLITSMITHRIGWHEVLLPVNQTLTKFVIFWAFLNQNSLSIRPSYGAREEEILDFRFHFSPFPQKRLILRLKSKGKKFRESFLPAVKKKSIWARAWWRVLSNYNVPLVLKSGQPIANLIWEFCKRSV